MNTLVVLIVLSGLLFIMYRIKVFRTKHPLLKKFNSSKANISLGVFLTSFGLNRLLVQPQVITYVVAGIFIVYGAFFTYDHIKRSRFYYQELRRNNENSSPL